MKTKSLRKSLSFCLFLSLSAIPLVGEASKARMDSLGGEDVASHHFNDTRNILINPAYMNSNKDFLIFEWGKDMEGPSTTDSSPKPEGGFFKSIGPFMTGLYLGHEEGYEGRNDAGPSNPPSFLFQDNPVEFFVAGDTGVEWGASLKFSHNKDEETIIKSQSSLKISLGTITRPWEGRISIDLFDKSQGGQTALEEYKGNLGLTMEAKYYFDDIVFFAKFNKSGFEYKRASDGKIDTEKDYYNWNFGGGQSLQLNEMAKLLLNFQYKGNVIKTNKNMATMSSRLTSRYWKFPLTIALEATTKDWLILRGSLTQNIISNEFTESGKVKSSKKSTEVAAGATLNLDKLKIDGLIGTTDSVGNSNKTGMLSLSNLLTKVSMAYWF